MKIPRRFATGRRASSGTPAPRSPKRWRIALPAWARGAMRDADRRFSLVALGVLAGAGFVGYLIAALVLFPAPIFAASSGIPNLRGLSPEQATERLTQRGFRLIDEGRMQHPDLPAGVIAWQDPPPEVVAPEGTSVMVRTSAGPQRVAVPDVAGYDVQIARMLLESAGLTVGNVETAPAPTPANIAVNTRPPAGATLPPGASITLVVSVGRATIRVPNLRGRTLDEARYVLDSLNLVLGAYFMRTDPTVNPGTIIYQRPDPGTLAPPGAAVEIRIARREDP